MWATKDRNPDGMVKDSPDTMTTGGFVVVVKGRRGLVCLLITWGAFFSTREDASIRSGCLFGGSPDRAEEV